MPIGEIITLAFTVARINTALAAGGIITAFAVLHGIYLILALLRR